MVAAVFYNQTFFRFPSCFCYRKQLKPGHSFCSLKADGSLAFPSQNGMLHLCLSSIIPDGSSGDISPQKNFAPRRAKHTDESEKYETSGSKQLKSSKQQEIIALFRRIQSSISKEKSTRSKKRITNVSETSATNSVLEVPGISRKKAKGINREGDKMLARKQGGWSREERIQNESPHSAADSKLSRPPSNFVRRSPIPPPSTPEGMPGELKSQAPEAKASSKELRLPGLEEMKLPELKELAKSRGIKGYSKLKKTELRELLRSFSRISS